MSRILIVDDEPDLVDLLTFNIESAGHTVATASNGLEALEAMDKSRPDAVLLDMMMPHMDGIATLKEMRKRPGFAGIPVIMLTARSAVEDRIKGFESGADDYLSKPFDSKELQLRLAAVLRRTEGDGGSPDILEVGSFRLDRETLRLDLDNQVVDLTATEFKLVLLLMQHEGEVQERDHLLRQVWGYRDSTLTRTLDTHIKRLREKIGEYAEHIETVRGVGYVFHAEV
ncbi:response regulator transcription factor [Sulfuriroseicoccus oceanibius]|uniref:Response regulator transcription factor n=1 Tax=Sulfuriroseicoccus oceanibius TaxID=2707525 RepID=A0A6B3L6X2_9BACT|nr:response regulator transcription factor [Sulfuriroseicoccus oceanibius]QQL44984.1 response regulator transcription factor [Sulfuriroseicoccus oceanibius]